MDFTLRCVRIFPGVNSRAELVTLAPDLRPERRLAPLARGLGTVHFLLGGGGWWFLRGGGGTRKNSDVRGGSPQKN